MPHPDDIMLYRITDKTHHGSPYTLDERGVSEVPVVDDEAVEADLYIVMYHSEEEAFAYIDGLEESPSESPCISSLTYPDGCCAVLVHWSESDEYQVCRIDRRRKDVTL
jgi:hypothetical protein